MVHLEGVEDRMIANNLEPFIPTHPGEIIKDEIVFRGISQRLLAKTIDVPAGLLNEVLNGKRPLSAEMALLIGQALNIDPAPLLAMQADFNLLSAKSPQLYKQDVINVLRKNGKQRDQHNVRMTIP